MPKNSISQNQIIWVSQTSRLEAHRFAVKYGLTETAEEELALMIEKAWMDGCEAERTMTGIREILKKGERKDNERGISG